ncbi:MAG TPA: prolyl oligopeptidase family serine peptidase [Planctomycetota bacterium]|nr:prolyl oligopeptidase family serine peptidase [Planctomycetota bacterium]
MPIKVARQQVVQFPRNGTPPDEHGYPHYGTLAYANERLRASYEKLQQARRNDRRALLAGAPNAQRRAVWKRRVETLRDSFADCLGLSVSTVRPHPPALTFVKAHLLGALGHILPEWASQLVAAYYRVNSAGWDGGDIEVMLIRSNSSKAPRTGVLLIPDAGAALTGCQTPEVVASTWGCALASAGFLVAIPRLPAQQGFSSTHNKRRILEGSCALGEIVAESARALDALLAQTDINGRVAWVGGRGLGAIAAQFLGLLDGRVGGVLADAPLAWGNVSDPQALVIPRSRPLTDEFEVCAALAPRPLAMVVGVQKNDVFSPTTADVKSLARSAQSAYALLKRKDHLAVFAPGDVKKTVAWMLEQSSDFADLEPAPGRAISGTYARRHFAIQQYTSLSDWQVDRRRLRREYKEKTGVPSINKPLHVKLEGEWALENYTRQEYHIRTGEDTISNVVFMRPQGAERRRTTILHLPGSGSDVAKVERQFAHEIVAEGWNACIIDARAALYPFHPGIAEGRAIISQSLHDLLCCLDWVAQRDDVDAERIGTMGVSQGGTHSWMLAAMDERIAAAAPVCGLCTYRSLNQYRTEWYGNDLLSFYDSHSIYYYTPGVLELGDQQDVAGLIAPRPLMVIGATHDNCFPLDGMREAAADLRHLYQLSGAASNFEYVEFDGPHSMPEHTRRTAYAFFHKHFD